MERICSLILGINGYIKYSKQGSGVRAVLKSCQDWIKQTKFYIVDSFCCFVCNYFSFCCINPTGLDLLGSATSPQARRFWVVA